MYTDSGLLLEDFELRDLLCDANAVSLLEAEIDVPVEEVALVAASEEKVAIFGHTEGHLVLGVQVHDDIKVDIGNDIKRLIRPVHCDKFAVNQLDHATSRVEPMQRVNFLKCGGSVESSCDLAKPLCVHPRLVVLFKQCSSSIHLLIKSLLTAVQFPGV